jgi:glycosyltransferase involved in cell wall biosynthesis
VIPQALAVGTAVVGTTVGGTPELVRDGESGRLVPPADAPALAAAILELIDDPERARALARHGQARVLAEYSMDATMARTLAVYEAARAAHMRY